MYQNKGKNMDVLLFTVKLKLCYDRSGPAHLTPLVYMVDHKNTQTNFILKIFICEYFSRNIYSASN